MEHHKMHSPLDYADQEVTVDHPAFVPTNVERERRRDPKRKHTLINHSITGAGINKAFSSNS